MQPNFENVFFSEKCHDRYSMHKEINISAYLGMAIYIIIVDRKNCIFFF